MALYSQTFGGGQCTGASSPQNAIVTSVGNGTVGKRLVVGIASIAGTAMPTACTDSVGNPYVALSAPNTLPNVRLFVAPENVQVVIGTTLNLSSWSLTRSLAVIWDEINAGSVVDHAHHATGATSDSPSDSLVTTIAVADIIAALALASTPANLVTFTEDADYEDGGERQHSTANAYIHLAYRQAFAAGTTTYNVSPLDSLMAPLTVAWNIEQQALGSDPVRGGQFQSMGIG